MMSWSVRKSLVARLVSTYFVLSLVVIASVGAVSWLAGRELLRDAVFERLGTSSRQKETDLALWVEERLRDLKFLGALLADSPDFRAAPGVPVHPGPETMRLLNDFKSSQQDIMEILVLAPTGGKVLASTEEANVGGYRASYNFYDPGAAGPLGAKRLPLAGFPAQRADGEHAPARRLGRAEGRAGPAPEPGAHRADHPLARGPGRYGRDLPGRFLQPSGGRGPHGHGGPPAPYTLRGRCARPFRQERQGAVRQRLRPACAWRVPLDARLPDGAHRRDVAGRGLRPGGRLALLLALVGLVAAVALGAGVYVLSRRLARPVLDVTSAAMRVAGGDLAARAPVETDDELGNLAKAFNAMTGELAELYDRLEQEGRERGAILHGSFDGIAVVGRNGAVAYCNPGMERLFGCTVEDTPSLAALADNIFPSPEERRTFVSNLEADMAEENPPERVFSFTHKSGVRRWCRLKVSPMGGQRLVINAQDLTEIKVSEERVRHMALHDHLTGLPNRQLFLDRLDQALRRAKRSSAHVAIVYIDLDHFKSLNDAYGHAHGDRVLVETALRLRACVRESDTVARLGGDEFVVVLPDLMHAGDALPVAEKIQQTLYDPEAGGGRMFLGASWGWPATRRTATTRIRCWPGPTPPCTRPSAPAATPCRWPGSRRAGGAG